MDNIKEFDLNIKVKINKDLIENLKEEFPDINEKIIAQTIVEEFFYQNSDPLYWDIVIEEDMLTTVRETLSSYEKVVCSVCGGTGQVKDENGNIVICPSCGGTGRIKWKKFNLNFSK